MYKSRERKPNSYLRKRSEFERKSPNLQMKYSMKDSPSTSRSALRRSKLNNDQVFIKSEVNIPKFKCVGKVTLHKDLNDTDTIIKCSLNKHTLRIISRPRLFGLCVHCLQKPNADRKKLHKITTYCPKCPGGCWTCEPCFDERHPIDQ